MLNNFNNARDSEFLVLWRLPPPADYLSGRRLFVSTRVRLVSTSESHDKSCSCFLHALQFRHRDLCNPTSTSARRRHVLYCELCCAQHCEPTVLSAATSCRQSISRRNRLIKFFNAKVERTGKLSQPMEWIMKGGFGKGNNAGMCLENENSVLLTGSKEIAYLTRPLGKPSVISQTNGYWRG